MSIPVQNKTLRKVSKFFKGKNDTLERKKETSLYLPPPAWKIPLLSIFLNCLLFSLRIRLFKLKKNAANIFSCCRYPFCHCFPLLFASDTTCLPASSPVCLPVYFIACLSVFVYFIFFCLSACVCLLYYLSLYLLHFCLFVCPSLSASSPLSVCPSFVCLCLSKYS